MNTATQTRPTMRRATVTERPARPTESDDQLVARLIGFTFAELAARGRGTASPFVPTIPGHDADDCRLRHALQARGIEAWPPRPCMFCGGK